MMPFRQLTATGIAKLYIANDNGTVIEWAFGGIGLPSIETDRTIPAYIPSSWDRPYTHTIINDIVYLNRADRVPWYVATDGTTMAELPVWDPTWRCESLRSTSGALVAINVTKGAATFPTMVKTSDFMTYGSTPASWTATPSNSATENILPTLSEPLIDGWNLRDRLVLYSAHETWLMEPTLDNQVFSYRRIFQDAGVLNQNCVVDYENKHYVFGYDDLWTHDGFQKKSLASSRVREFIYNYIVRGQSTQCFTFHNPILNEIAFCYLSTDPYCAFPVGGAYGFLGCNRACVYNYNHDTFYFYDLPYIRSVGEGLASVTPTYATMGSTTYATVGLPYFALTSSGTLTHLTCSPAQTVGTTLDPAVRSFEQVSSAFTNGPVDTNANPPIYIENRYVDLDKLSAEIRGYKVISAVYPQAHFDGEAAPITFYFGGSDYSNSPAPVYGTGMTFDGTANYKLDFMTSGRFLSFKMTYPDYRYFQMSGLDLDFVVTGKR